MKKVAMLLLLSLLSTPLFAGVLIDNVTARPNEKGHWNIDAGLTATPDFWDVILTPAVNTGFGITDKLTIGGAVETPFSTYFASPIALIVSAWGKYALFNEAEGLSLALEGGIGGAPNSAAFAYVGPIASYKFKHMEPYISVHAMGGLIDSSHIGFINSTVGNTLWFNETFGLGANLKFVNQNPLSAGLNMSFRF